MYYWGAIKKGTHFCMHAHCYLSLQLCLVLAEEIMNPLNQRNSARSSEACLKEKSVHEEYMWPGKFFHNFSRKYIFFSRLISCIFFSFYLFKCMYRWFLVFFFTRIYLTMSLEFYSSSTDSFLLTVCWNLVLWRLVIFFSHTRTNRILRHFSIRLEEMRRGEGLMSR